MAAMMSRAFAFSPLAIWVADSGKVCLERSAAGSAWLGTGVTGGGESIRGGSRGAAGLSGGESKRERWFRDAFSRATNDEPDAPSRHRETAFRSRPEPTRRANDPPYP